MFSFLRRKKEAFDLGSLKVDMHSHLIPGIDDGARDLDDSMRMIQKLVDLGYQKIITTPHIYWDYYKNTPEIINDGLHKVKEAMDKQGIDLEIEVAAEYYFDANFLKEIREENLMTFGDNHVLFELPFSVKAENVDQLVFQLVGNGYKPILAHYERYVYYHSPTLEMAKDFRRRGILLQMNLLSLAGHYGPEIQKQAELMIELDLVDFVGTDCHRIEHLHILEKALSSKSFQKLKEAKLMNHTLV